MWSTKCHYCESNDIALSSKYYCTDCEQIKKIAGLYGIETIRKCCDEIFIRNAEPINNRTKLAATKVQTRSQAKQTQTIEDKKSSN